MIFAFSFGDSVVNHFASLCVRISGQLVRRSVKHVQLFPAARAGSDSCQMLAVTNSGSSASKALQAYLIAIDGDADGLNLLAYDID
jgi:hypothetical protein